jgi:hypothetical protein
MENGNVKGLLESPESPQKQSWQLNIDNKLAHPNFDSTTYVENLTLETSEAQAVLQTYQEPPEGFDKVGFARPLGGFFYEFFYAIVAAIAVAVTFSLILKALYPYPDSKAYASVGNVLFSLVFFVMNIPTAFSLEIFIAQYRVKNPAKMIQYARFYIWYQMMTGIILVTITSLYVLYIMQTGNLMYTKWLLLILISREYPAMTGVFNAMLKGVQRFDYQTKVNYFGQIIQPLCEVVCVLIGRYWLGSNPMFGELMGIAIGYAIGTYVDDFLTMLFSLRYLRTVLEPMGYSIRDVLIPHVDKEVWKDSLWFGLKLSPPGLLSAFVGFFAFFWWYDLVPAYATLMVLNETADSIANIIRRGGGIYLKGTIAESLGNGKKELTHFYIAFALKFSFMTMIALAAIVFTFMPAIIDVLFVAGGLEAWSLMTVFITPNIIESTTEQVHSISTDVILGGKHPGWHSFTEILRTLIQFLWDFLLLFVFKWPQTAPIVVLIWILALRDFPNKFTILVLNYIYIQKKIVKIRWSSFAWQAWIAPIPATIGVWGCAAIWLNFVFPILENIMGVYIAAGISILIGFLLLLWVFFPLYTFFGGWDNYGLQIFTNAVEIAGPSKFLFRPIVKANKLLVKSPFHNKHPIPWEKANEEAEILMRERYVKQTINEYIINHTKI